MTRRIEPSSPVGVLTEISMPATKAQRAARVTATKGLRALTEPAKTARPATTLAASMWRARSGYGASLSRKATFRAPVPMIRPAERDPEAAPMANGAATPRVLRRAIHGLILSIWKRTTLCQNACQALGLDVSIKD